MRNVGWLTVGIAALLLSACSKGGEDDGTGGRNGGVGANRAITGSGGKGGSTGSGMFGKPSNPSGSGGSTVMVPDDGTCAKSNITATRIIPTVLLLLDGSFSMTACYGPAAATAPDSGVAAGMCDPNAGPPIPGLPPVLPPGTLSRWDAIRRAVADPDVGVVKQLQDRVNFGVAVYGTEGAMGCPLPLGVVGPVLNNFDAIAANVPAAPPGTYTPTGIALDLIVEMLQDPLSALDVTIGPQIVVLATDGDPNTCDVPVTDTAPSIAAANKLLAKNQKMYVISVGDDATATHLQEMANIGAGLPPAMNPGAPVYYPEDPAALADTLEMLIGKELSCDVSLSGEGVVASLACTGTVLLNGAPLECNGPDGWELKDSLHITLKGAACETFKEAADANLMAEFPCEALIID